MRIMQTVLHQMAQCLTTLYVKTAYNVLCNNFNSREKQDMTDQNHIPNVHIVLVKHLTIFCKFKQSVQQVFILLFLDFQFSAPNL